MDSGSLRAGRELETWTLEKIKKNRQSMADMQKQEVKNGNRLQVDKWKLEGCYRFTVPSLHNILQKRLHDSQVQHLPFQV